MNTPIVLCSIDIGIRNFAQYIEVIQSKDIEELILYYQTLPKKFQRKVKGPMNEYVQYIIDELFYRSEIKEIGVYDLTSNESGDFSIHTKKALFNHLNNFRNLFSQVDILIIEQQYFSNFLQSKLGKFTKKSGSEANVKAIKVAECVQSWFLINFPHIELINFNSTFKTHTIGAPCDLTKAQRKKWSVDTFRELLELKEDTMTLQKLAEIKKTRSGNGKLQKLDDVADAALQCLAYKYRYLVAQFTE